MGTNLTQSVKKLAGTTRVKRSERALEYMQKAQDKLVELKKKYGIIGGELSKDFYVVRDLITDAKFYIRAQEEAKTAGAERRLKFRVAKEDVTGIRKSLAYSIVIARFMEENQEEVIERMMKSASKRWFTVKEVRQRMVIALSVILYLD